MAIELLREWLAKSSSNGSRSSVLAQPGWLVVTLLLVNLTAWGLGLPPPMTDLLRWLLIGVIVLWGALLIYFAIRDPDALRSERFTIEKLAIQRGLVGDNLAGMQSLENGSDKAAKPIPIQTAGEVDR